MTSLLLAISANPLDWLPRNPIQLAAVAVGAVGLVVALVFRQIQRKKAGL